MKTLVVHPADRSTDFLKPIYEGRGWTVVNNVDSPWDLADLMASHDRLVMMGHGTPGGLLGLRISSWHKWVSLFRAMQDNVFIWCNADRFVESTGLSNLFYTGMIISEVPEARAMDVPATAEQVERSNTLFTEAIRSAIDLSPQEMVKQAKSIYVDAGNPVVQFNYQRLYWR